MSEYTYQVLRVVVAQICQTIGWHSIQSTPLELLVDILHKYLQEISRETYRHTELYGRTEPNLVDVGLAFRNLNINLSDIEEYVNYVDCVGCSIDVPKYPVHKDSNLNFLKPGSKEVLTRPVHIPEYLPPIYPEKEEGQIDEIKKESSSDGNNVDVVSLPSSESTVFKKPEITDNPAKKPKIFVEEEGRPTREISSVMMTSSGFISPAREGKLPDAKSPIIPEYKSPPAPPPLTAIVPPSLPVGNIDSKFDKKDKKKKSNVLAEKEQRRKEKLLKDSNKHSHTPNDVLNPMPEKLKPVKKQKNKQKHRGEHVKEQVTDEILTKPEFNLSLRSESVSFPPPTLSIPMDLDIKPKVDEIKLSCEPSKEKLNIFKKISTTKKERDDLCRSPGIFHDAHLLSSIPEGTTITPAPFLKHHYPAQQQNTPIVDDDQVICVDDEPGFQAELAKNLPPTLPQNLLPPGTTIKAQTPKRPRKKAQQQQQQLLDQNLPLNLSNEITSAGQNPINMVKKDLIQIPRLLYLSQKPPKEKKERKKPKAKESKKDLLPPPPVQNPLPTQNPTPSSFSDKNLRDSLFFKDFPLNQKLGKTDSILPNNPNPYVSPNFPNVQPPIPMFPFYPFPPRPGLIPNPGLFPPLQPMPDNPAFNKFLPMMRFGNFGNMNKGPRLTSTYDDEPLPLPPIDTEKTYCNVAPLVPDSMKFQLSPTRLKPNKLTTATSFEATFSDSGHPGEAGPSLSKQTKILDSPIEISDDENVKSGGEDREPDRGEKSSGPNDTVTGSTKADAQNVSEDIELRSGFNDEKEEKGEKRKDKMHKKGKKEKEGKIKKKKDKKDKSKSKEKAEKKKEKDEKKDKEKVRKLKKEKKKDKLRALAYSAEESKVDSTNPDSSQHSTVPKLTLKIGLGNSPQPDSPDGRKIDDMTDSFDDVKMTSFDRRESSPELARISPLVTRPPKQKTSSNDNLASVMPPNHSSVENRLPQSNFSGNSPTLHRNIIGATTSSVAASMTPTTSQLSPGVQKCSQFNQIYDSGTFTKSTNSDKFGNTKVDTEPEFHSQHMATPVRNNSTASLPHSSGQRISSTSTFSTPPVTLATATTFTTNSTTSGYRQAQYSSSSQMNTFLLSAVESNRPSSYIDAEGNQVWICPACGRVDDGTPMIGCDGCDAWYHWVCVGIQVPPDDNEDWYCRVCIAKKQEAHGADKKRKRKKKSKAN